MEIFLECLPCTLRQTLEASQMATNDVALQGKIMQESIKVLSGYNDLYNSPDLCRKMHQVVKDMTGVDDPYAQVKKKHIAAAKKLYPFLQEFLKKHDSLYWLLKTVAVGNTIDSAVNNSVNIEHVIEEELKKEFAICDIDIMEDKLTTATSMLIIGDNAGETVFDKLLTDHFSDMNITYAVRSEAVINDATADDAYASGLGEHAQIISTGCSSPGVILDECSQEFMDIYHTADIIISKGQGNYEGLSECADRVFFLLKAKCPMLSSHLQVGHNEYVFKYSSKK